MMTWPGQSTLARTGRSILAKPWPLILIVVILAFTTGFFSASFVSKIYPPGTNTINLNFSVDERQCAARVYGNISVCDSKFFDQIQEQMDIIARNSNGLRMVFKIVDFKVMNFTAMISKAADATLKKYQKHINSQTAREHNNFHVAMLIAKVDEFTGTDEKPIILGASYKNSLCNPKDAVAVLAFDGDLHSPLDLTENALHELGHICGMEDQNEAGDVMTGGEPPSDNPKLFGLTSIKQLLAAKQKGVLACVGTSRSMRFWVLVSYIAVVTAPIILFGILYWYAYKRNENRQNTEPV